MLIVRICHTKADGHGLLIKWVMGYQSYL